MFATCLYGSPKLEKVHVQKAKSCAVATGTFAAIAGTRLTGSACSVPIHDDLCEAARLPAANHLPPCANGEKASLCLCAAFDEDTRCATANFVPAPSTTWENRRPTATLSVANPSEGSTRDSTILCTRALTTRLPTQATNGWTDRFAGRPNCPLKQRQLQRDSGGRGPGRGQPAATFMFGDVNQEPVNFGAFNFWATARLHCCCLRQLKTDS